MSSLEEQLEEQVQKIGVLLEVMTDELDRLKQQRQSYIKAVNRIDDYFEYSSESDKDQKKVYGILDDLREQLSQIK